MNFDKCFLSFLKNRAGLPPLKASFQQFFSLPGDLKLTEKIHEYWYRSGGDVRKVFLQIISSTPAIRRISVKNLRDECQDYNIKDSNIIIIFEGERVCQKSFLKSPCRTPATGTPAQAIV